jgi:glycosyltransferase involved in cell wall biosynthesis
MAQQRIGILVVAYNAASTLATVLDRIPHDFRGQVTKILVGDDASRDSTHLVALGYQQLATDMPIEVVRHAKNLGYGGNQKAGYQWAIDDDLDIVVLLHGDGQYAPELLPELVAPLMRNEADAVFGSRMLDKGGARRGGMPMYKFVGNRILTRFENIVAGVSLSEWHSGYRAYSVSALRDVPFHDNHDGFDFDTQVILQLIEAGKRIVEVPIPTYYGDEISHVNGIGYARDVTWDVLRYRAHKMGFGSGELAFASVAYDQKQAAGSSHDVVTRWLADRRAARILDLGCSDGALAERLRALGHHVTGVDVAVHEGVEERVDTFIEADFDRGIPQQLEAPFDVILAADVLEHVRTPEQILDQLKPLLAPGGSVIVSVPNFGHWYPRVRVAVGRFDYDRRGILDRDHVRFFTKPSFERLIRNCGYSVARRSATGLPLEVVDRGGQGDTASSGISRVVSRIDRATIALRPQLFAYQFVYELRDDPRHPCDDAGAAAVKTRRIQPRAAIRRGRTRVGE